MTRLAPGRLVGARGSASLILKDSRRHVMSAWVLLGALDRPEKNFAPEKTLKTQESEEREEIHD